MKKKNEHISKELLKGIRKVEGCHFSNGIKKRNHGDAIMKTKAVFPGVLMCFILLFCSCGGQSDFHVLEGPYLGQPPPENEPVIFAPGLVSTHFSQSYIAFLNEGRVCVFSAGTGKGHETYFTYEKDGSWTKPKRAPFEELQGHPNYTTGPLGRRVFYHSGNPTHPNDTRPDDNIWTIEWTGSGWAEPEALPEPANSEFGEAYPSAAADGTVYFFTWRRPGTRGDDIWFSRCINGRYQEAERLPWPLNTDFIEYDPYVAPDESFLIFGSDRPGGYGESDNYICFRKEDGNWTPAINLGFPYNSTTFDLCANGTPDGKYFFFTSGRKTNVDKGEIGKKEEVEPERDADLYWADFSFIEDLKQTLLTKHNAAEIIKQNYEEKGIKSAVDTLNRLYSSQRDSVYFLPYELLFLCKHMMDQDKIQDADVFASALEERLPEELSIMAGYARICAVNGYVSKGLKIFEELESEDPDFQLNDALSALGYLFTLYPEKTDDALRVLDFTVKKYPDDPWAYFSLARVYRRLGDMDKAVENCRKSLELEPNVGDISQLLERLEEEQKKKKAREESFPALKGPYLGQKPPGMTPEIFVPGIISTGRSEQQIAFAPDGRELFLWLGENRPYCTILWMKDEGEGWHPLQVALFSGKYVDMKFSFSPDGNTFFFSSNRPHLRGGKPSDNLDIWSVERHQNGWGQPILLNSPVNTESHDYYPVTAGNGNLYFMSDRDGGMGEDDIYVACFEDGKLKKAKNIGPPINTALNEGDPFIAQDESYLIFCCRDREGGFGNNDLYISFRKADGSWTEPINMGASINTLAEEVCPVVTHDGKYLFFSSNRKRIDGYPESPLTYEQIIGDLAGPGNGSNDIYWVDAKIIDELRPDELKKEPIRHVPMD